MVTLIVVEMKPRMYRFVTRMEQFNARLGEQDR